MKTEKSAAAIVICKLPKAGLGNQLFPLMKAAVFSNLNGLPLVITNYHQIKLGPWIRREKSKRSYSGFFTFQKSPLSAQIASWNLRRYKENLIENEPELKMLPASEVEGRNFIFSEMPHYECYFKGLKENRELVIELFWKMIHPHIVSQLAAQKTPVIGVHVRLGDFRNLKKEEAFGTVGTVRTPEAYFIETIKKIRKMNGLPLPVSVFTDGYPKDLKFLSSLENIAFVSGNNDLVDMLLLSKSKIIITSATSTFSYWSAFLSRAVVIMHPFYLHQPLRPSEINRQYFEGPFDGSNLTLKKLVSSLHYD